MCLGICGAQGFLPNLLSIPEGSKLKYWTPDLRSWRPLHVGWFRILFGTEVLLYLSVVELYMKKFALFYAAVFN